MTHVGSNWEFDFAKKHIPVYLQNSKLKEIILSKGEGLPICYFIQSFGRQERAFTPPLQKLKVIKNEKPAKRKLGKENFTISPPPYPHF